MKELLVRLGEIGEKAEYLNQKSEMLVEANRALRNRIAELESQLTERNEAFEELSSQHEILKLARKMDGDGENAASEEIKKKINEYIREIDQCLRLIGD